MKVAVVGSRGLHITDLGAYLPPGTTEIISGGAVGIDTCAADYARSRSLKLTVFKPNYDRYGGKAAPLIRNRLIVDAADMVLAIWDGRSRGTMFTVNYARQIGKPVEVVRILCNRG